MTYTSEEMIARLVGFPTVSRDSNLELIEFVRAYLAGHGVQSRLVPSPEGDKASLYATVGPMVEGGVVLSGHTDVVPVDGQPWTSDPFTLVERGGRLYGRGTCDMKSFYAVALAMVPGMLERGLARPVHFALSYDEEVGCTGGLPMIRRLAEELPRPRAVIVGEPSDMRVVTAQKGMRVMETVVTGHEAHSSQTHRGVSAVMTGARLIARLDEMARERAAGSRCALPFDPPYTSIHVGVVEGGTALNIIARECRFTWDVRNIPEDDAGAIVEAFDAWCRAEVLPGMREVAPESDIVTRVGSAVPALREETGGGAEELARMLTGDNSRHAVVYCTEGGQFQDAGFSTVICGPGSIDQAHQPDEYIEVSQVRACEVFMEKLADVLAADA